MQMFMYETWKDKPEYGIRTQYCGFACNIYFELYKRVNGPTRYYVFYYLDDEFIYKFDYDEFDETVREHMYTQDNITDYCITDEEKEEEQKKKKKKKNKRKNKKKKKEKKMKKEKLFLNLLKIIHYYGLDFSLLFLLLF